MMEMFDENVFDDKCARQQRFGQKERFKEREKRIKSIVRECGKHSHFLKKMSMRDVEKFCYE